MIINQRTLKTSFLLTGKGLHSGLSVKIKFNPAPENHGYKIRRIDLPNKPIIDAVAENVVSTERRTVLGSSIMQIGTVEHALAALYGCEIDNCLIDVDAPEFPIMDGSSISFVQKILETGTVTQNAKRIYLSFPRKKIKVRDEISGASLSLTPNESFSIKSSISFDSVLLKQQGAYLSDLSLFVRDFAPARTFVFVREIESLIDKNLIKGGDLDNAIIIYDQVIQQDKLDNLSDMLHVKKRNANHLGYMMNKPLNISNEPARHKLLDIIGDIALVGYFIKGKIEANHPGHAINNLFAKEIRKNIILEKRSNTLNMSGFYWNEP
ncbi:UDP-3-O-acyl-N-acetylglucosamine deacetylase [uncultured Dysgonomonas sp.]|uniref:UDP-3-O-acyl-N-acetylglucosamine deacetylase n=1 Tax=uncultured Dysgonomonas sp. TaxID=206096 RepID=A0A212JDJ4_9BACT|nr:UDP-3-O-acyl-N-acetylglucosamine deacetylase [uncultured Dysgonomonas sp.]SBV97462.1 UDP-3-O-(3-hydroxymyristoyl) N-acetylglucosamine deacetylase [uncultured Dysgonomonas sp.]